VREDVLAGLSLEEDAEEHLRELTAVLDATRKQMAERLEEAGTDAPANCS
jgi:cell division protein ZapA (FtsZ GTPase activity inhibitor)